MKEPALPGSGIDRNQILKLKHLTILQEPATFNLQSSCLDQAARMSDTMRNKQPLPAFPPGTQISSCPCPNPVEYVTGEYKPCKCFLGCLSGCASADSSAGLPLLPGSEGVLCGHLLSCLKASLFSMRLKCGCTVVIDVGYCTRAASLPGAKVAGGSAGSYQQHLLGQRRVALSGSAENFSNSFRIPYSL